MTQPKKHQDDSSPPPPFDDKLVHLVHALRSVIDLILSTLTYMSKYKKDWTTESHTENM